MSAEICQHRVAESIDQERIFISHLMNPAVCADVRKIPDVVEQRVDVVEDASDAVGFRRVVSRGLGTTIDYVLDRLPSALGYRLGQFPRIATGYRRLLGLMVANLLLGLA